METKSKRTWITQMMNWAVKHERTQQRYFRFSIIWCGVEKENPINIVHCERRSGGFEGLG